MHNQLSGLLIYHCPLCSNNAADGWQCCFACVQVWQKDSCTASSSLHPANAARQLWFTTLVAIFTACYCLWHWALRLICYLILWLQMTDLLFTVWSAVAVPWHFIARLSHLITYLYVNPYHSSPVSSAIPSASILQTADLWVFYCQNWDNWCSEKQAKIPLTPWTSLTTCRKT